MLLSTVSTLADLPVLLDTISVECVFQVGYGLLTTVRVWQRGRDDGREIDSSLPRAMLRTCMRSVGPLLDSSSVPWSYNGPISWRSCIPELYMCIAKRTKYSYTSTVLRRSYYSY